MLLFNLVSFKRNNVKYFKLTRHKNFRERNMEKWGYEI